MFTGLRRSFILRGRLLLNEALVMFSIKDTAPQGRYYIVQLIESPFVNKVIHSFFHSINQPIDQSQINNYNLALANTMHGYHYVLYLSFGIVIQWQSYHGISHQKYVQWHSYVYYKRLFNIIIPKLENSNRRDVKFALVFYTITNAYLLIRMDTFYTVAIIITLPKSNRFLIIHRHIQIDTFSQQ